jgi:Glycosyl-4,4'-diaponeurosporenoate acyltransferase
VNIRNPTRIKKQVALYNMIPNLVWSALFLVPITLFCYTSLNSKIFFFFLGASLITLFLPNIFFDFIQLSKKRSFYQRIGVRFINKFAQNGYLLNRYLRSKHPNYRTVSKEKASIKKQLNQTYFFEKFHFCLFIFFSSVTVYAVVKDYPVWAVILSISNLLYNIYPNLLQQYIRVKLANVKDEFKQSTN